MEYSISIFPSTKPLDYFSHKHTSKQIFTKLCSITSFVKKNIYWLQSSGQFDSFASSIKAHSKIDITYSNILYLLNIPLQLLHAMTSRDTQSRDNLSACHFQRLSRTYKSLFPTSPYQVCEILHLFMLEKLLFYFALIYHIQVSELSAQQHQKREVAPPSFVSPDLTLVYCWHAETEETSALQ